MGSIELLADFILVMGMVVICMIIGLLFKSKRNVLSQRILIVLFFFLFMVTFHFYGGLHELDGMMPFTLLFEDPVVFFIGPLLYLYVKSIFEDQTNLIRNNLPHFIPVSLYFCLVTLPIFISLLLDRPIFAYLPVLLSYGNYHIVVQQIYLLLYLLLALKQLAKYQGILKFNYSNLQEKDLEWIKYLLIGLVVVMGVDIASTIYEFFAGEADWETGFLTIIAMIFLVSYLGYHGTIQARILLPDFLLEKMSSISNNKTDDPPIVHHLSNTGEAEIEALKTRLIKVLEKDKPYLDEDLTLGGLAELIPTTDKKLSALLNHYLEVSFYDLINSCRVEEVKSKLADNRFHHYTLLSLAFDCGFKSKTSFNRIFKKTTNLSPSQYRKQLLG